MNPVALVVFEALIKYGPTVAREIQKIFSKTEITQEDWDKVFDLAEKSYEEYTRG